MRLFLKLSAAFLFVLGTGGFSAVAAQTAKTEEWFVADKQVDCTGVAPQKCLVVREVNSPDWQYFYGSIRGFNFRDGYTQKIRVSIAPQTNVPADAAAMDYKLIEVLSRSKTDGNTLEEAEAAMKNQKAVRLDNQKWLLTEIENVPVASNLGHAYFNSQRFSARICNGMSGCYQQTGANLKFSRIIATMMACREPRGSIETKFQSALGKVTRVERNGDVLVLLAEATPVLKFEAEPKPLAGTKWILLDVENEPVKPNGDAPYLWLEKEKMKFSGFSGCNQMFGNYELNGGALKFGDAAMTRKACVEKSAEKIETKFMAALKKINRYEMKNGVLNLYADDQKLLSLGS